MAYFQIPNVMENNTIFVNVVSFSAYTSRTQCGSPVCTCEGKCSALWYLDWHLGSSVPDGAVPQHACSPPGGQSCDVPGTGKALAQVVGQAETQAPVDVGCQPPATRAHTHQQNCNV
jgi:hypothetical protein